ncbi:hypothetical protein MN608_08724 [Microdochium nivale]|nr:hypothetical protein MN608_08724 [Microdochium nivale]
MRPVTRQRRLTASLCEDVARDVICREELAAISRVEDSVLLADDTDNEEKADNEPVAPEDVKLELPNDREFPALEAVPTTDEVCPLAESSELERPPEMDEGMLELVAAADADEFDGETVGEEPVEEPAEDSSDTVADDENNGFVVTEASTDLEGDTDSDPVVSLGETRLGDPELELREIKPDVIIPDTADTALELELLLDSISDSPAVPDVTVKEDEGTLPVTASVLAIVDGSPPGSRPPPPMIVVTIQLVEPFCTAPGRASVVGTVTVVTSQDVLLTLPLGTGRLIVTGAMVPPPSPSVFVLVLDDDAVPSDASGNDDVETMDS